MKIFLQRGPSPLQPPKEIVYAYKFRQKETEIVQFNSPSKIKILSKGVLPGLQPPRIVYSGIYADKIGLQISDLAHQIQNFLASLHPPKNV